MTDTTKVAAVIVTYNRKELLRECLAAVLQQTFPLYRIIIIDNASTDGTEEMLVKNNIIGRKDVDYHQLQTNTGGAGGFYCGLEIANKLNVDWTWIMDDDTIPRPDSLKNLIKHTDNHKRISFLASCVSGEHGEPMNVPIIDDRKADNGYSTWYFHLDEKLVEISAATFVSLLINNEAIKNCGLPCRDYFIWGDDVEYTRRLTTYFGKAYLVGESWVCHKRESAKTIHLKNENDKTRIKNYRYLYRNRLINFYIYDGIGYFGAYMFRFEIEAFGMLFQGHNALLKFVIVQRGIGGAIIHKGKFKKYIENELSVARNDTLNVC